MSMKKEIFFSIDIETDGPIPLQNSMLSFACAAFDSKVPGRLLGTFERNLFPLEGARQDPKTMSEFWSKNPDAWAVATSNQVPAANAMQDFVKWVNTFEGKPVAVCFPAGFDFTFMYVYMINFAGESPFSFSCLDIKSYASAILKLPYREASKKNWPRRWFHPTLNHTHKAVDDAIEQGFSFSKMRVELLEGIYGSRNCESEFNASVLRLKAKE